DCPLTGILDDTDDAATSVPSRGAIAAIHLPHSRGLSDDLIRHSHPSVSLSSLRRNLSLHPPLSHSHLDRFPQSFQHLPQMA
ncbi:hypothetical protein PMAYCL1PPCAC_11550, partial [Pristionchus mayeri]